MADDRFQAPDYYNLDELLTEEQGVSFYSEVIVIMF